MKLPRKCLGLTCACLFLTCLGAADGISQGLGAQPEFFSRQIHKAYRFYLDLAPSPDEPLAVVCGGRESCSPNYSIHRTSFPYYSLEFVAKGSGSLTLNGHEYALRPGTLFTYGPDTAHDISTDPGDPLEK